MANARLLERQKQHLDNLLQKLTGLIQSWANYWLSKLVLHLSICLPYFKDTTKWDESVPACTQTLLEHLYDVYKADNPTSDTPAPKAPSVATSVFLQAIQNLTPAEQRAVITKIEAFFSSTYQCLDGDALNWWMVCVLFMTVAFMLLIVHLAATCSWFPSACSYCMQYSGNSRSEYLSWTALFRQETHTLRFSLLFDCTVVIKDCCC